MSEAVADITNGSSNTNVDPYCKNPVTGAAVETANDELEPTVGRF